MGSGTGKIDLSTDLKVNLAKGRKKIQTPSRKRGGENLETGERETTSLKTKELGQQVALN